MTDFATYHVIKGILNADPATKQDLGRRFAKHLGLTPGPRGSDDGIDGVLFYNGRKIHFQSKLKGERLDKDEARLYYSDLKYHKVDVSIMLAGIGYKDTFRERLFGHDGISNVTIHLLTLRDIFEETSSFQSALKDLPPLEELGKVAKGSMAIEFNTNI
ncbi:MAG: restriction endonuclease [Oscillatoria sp. SIO1A7]|nr:restriction endonuclease [Oscillatoria sp. SIO1A7]